MTLSAQQYLVFTLDEHRYALELAAVERVVRAVALTPLPGSPAHLPGVIDVHGEIVLVVDTRRRLGRPARALDPADHLVLIRAAGRALGLIVDAVLGVATLGPDEVVPASSLLAGAGDVGGVGRLGEGLTLLLASPERLLDAPAGRAADADGLGAGVVAPTKPAAPAQGEAGALRGPG